MQKEIDIYRMGLIAAIRGESEEEQNKILCEQLLLKLKELEGAELQLYFKSAVVYPLQKEIIVKLVFPSVDSPMSQELRDEITRFERNNVPRRGISQ